MAFLGCQLCPLWMDREDPCSGELEHKPSCWYEGYREAAAAWEINRDFLKWRYDNGAFAEDGGPGGER